MRPRDAFLALFLAAQVGLPLHYYLLRAEPPASYDERFAWRMFSPVRMLKCEYRYAIGGETVSLGSRVHVAWSSLIKRGRAQVAQAVGEHLCAEGRPVTVRLRCKVPGGEHHVIEDGGRDLCAGRP